MGEPSRINREEYGLHSSRAQAANKDSLRPGPPVLRGNADSGLDYPYLSQRFLSVIPPAQIIDYQEGTAIGRENNIF